MGNLDRTGLQSCHHKWCCFTYFSWKFLQKYTQPQQIHITSDASIEKTNLQWKQVVQGLSGNYSKEKWLERTFESYRCIADIHDDRRYIMNAFPTSVWDFYLFNLMFEISVYIFIIHESHTMCIKHKPPYSPKHNFYGLVWGNTLDI